MIVLKNLGYLRLGSSAAIFRLKAREQSSSVIVRYVPKNSSARCEPLKDSASKDSRENANFEIARSNLLPVEISKNARASGSRSAVFEEKSLIQTGTRNEVALPDHANPGLEGNIGQGFGVIHNVDMDEPLEVALEMEIHEGEDVDEMDARDEVAREYLSVSPPCKSIHDAEKLAIDLLAVRAFTTVELRKKLTKKAFSPKDADIVINKFQKRGWINDGMYAETFSQSRWSASSWGPRRIKQALLMKGVNQSDAEKAIKHVFEGAESDSDQESKLGMSKLSMDHLFVQASKQWHRSRDASKETRKSRVIRWLQYRGFNWAVICIIMKKLESQDPT